MAQLVSRELHLLLARPEKKIFEQPFFDLGALRFCERVGPPKCSRHWVL
jgi:hypothetical protein